MKHELIDRYPIISDQVDARELSVILAMCERALEQTEQGAFTEFGCYAGTTSLFIARLLRHQNREFHVYDSFAGLPDKTTEDISPAGEQFKTGELLASKKMFITHFKKAGLQLPVIHKCWFSDLTEDDVPAQIALAFLDGDYYQSIIDPLKLIWPRLVSGAIVVVDDYQNEALPGARRAVDDWVKTHPADVRTEASLGIITKA
jgi:O-methyltransferase